MKQILLLLLRAYKLGISPFLGQNCRFYPSCSDYAAQAIHEYGALHGGALAARRLCKCHPWNPGGVDLVPERKHQSSQSAGSSNPDSSSAAKHGCGHS
ncbi:MAG: membrane protein insertion efficiency factor YidD [Herbaspirillum sp.]